MDVSKKRTLAKKTYSKSKKAKYTTRAPAIKRWVPVAPKAGYGNNLPCTFIYSTKFTINGGTLGTAAIQQFNLSSLFDPDLTGVGTQPIPLDQYSALYERYRVYEASFKLHFMNSTTNDLIVGYNICDQATTTSDLERLVQNGQCEWSGCSARGSSKDFAEFTATVDLAKAHGITKKRLMSDDVYAAVFSASPAEAMILNCFCADSSNGDPGAFNCYIEIRFKAYLEGNQLVVTS